ncbi:MAG: hypothetical protein HYR96_13040 [Deltaproteobacteria bacterium]|nr:hypothetical protein [Deltaproteobacteria bacterium]MBI3293950.1 hypothetical protein [Deltaproteobacteria bacterium]
MPLNSRTVSWIESLAHQEGEIASGERLSIDIVIAKETVLKNETIHYVRALQAEFRELSGFLNRRLPSSSPRIHVVGLGETEEGFLIERAPLKLTFRAQMGVVQFVCERLLTNELQFSGAIEAKFGPFYELEWLFLGKPVTPEPLARHYLTELLQATGQLRH